MDDEGLTPEQRAQLRAAVLRKGPLAASGPSEVDPEQGTSGAGFYAASVSAMRDIQTASSSGDAAAAAAAEARAIALWRKWKVQPGGLPALRQGEALRQCADRGFTLINPLLAASAPADASAASAGGSGCGAGRSKRTSGSADSDVGTGATCIDQQFARLCLLLERARIPRSFAAALADAAGGDAGAIVCGCERSWLESVAKAASLPLGHRLRLINAAVATT